MQRLYREVICAHFAENRQMLFLAGPRQVGKTTTARAAAAAFPAHLYLDWDEAADREVVLGGTAAVLGRLGADRLRQGRPLCIFDELHKYVGWRGFLKGLFDLHERAIHILVTGSGRLDVFRHGGDSLMGRYFPYRMHPLSVAELLRTDLPSDAPIRAPGRIPNAAFEGLERFGGFPEPYARGETAFLRRWHRTRRQQLLHDDLRDLTRVHEVGRIEVLVELVRRQAGGLENLTSYATALGAPVESVRNWTRVLESLYHSFTVRPYTRNLARSLRKQPKRYLWDWSEVDDPGARAENWVACALLKAVHFWTDHGLGEFALHFIRDKEKREVDFCVVREGRAWFLVEVKRSGAAPLSPHLARFQAATGAAHAFQVAFDLPYVDRDCFEVDTPVIVPARTFLSQLV